MKYLVAGGGGMIGSAMVRRLLDNGEDVLAVDIKPIEDWWQVHDCAHAILDLRYETDCKEAVSGVDRIVMLAESMGGIGYISSHHAECSITGALIHANMIQAAAREGVDRYLFSSSACAYSQQLQQTTDVAPLREVDAWPADPEPGYGLIKLAAEEWCRYARADWNLPTVIARYHNIAGPPCTWEGGKEKAPAAICRKVATAAQRGDKSIDIWGDGKATRSFCWIDDCIEGSLRLMESNYPDPVNIGSAEMVTVNELADVVETIAFGGPTLERIYDLSAPEGVRGRNSDNELCRFVLGWEPSTPLRDWMPKLYEWVAEQVAKTSSI